MNLNKKKELIVGSFFALLFPIYFIITWISAIQTASEGILRKEHFFSFFPEFLQNTVYLTGLAIICCIITFVCGFMALPTQNRGWQAAALVLMAISALLAAWFLFTLM